MPHARGIFPTKDPEFNTYINTGIPYLDTHKARLGVSNANINALKDLHDDPGGTSGWLQIYPLSKNLATRTKTITGLKNTLRDQIEDSMRDIFDDIPKSALTQTDRDTLNLKERDTTPTARAQITTAPFVDFKAEEGGIILVTCRVAKDSDRASMHEAADVIQMKYIITEVEATPPATAADCPSTFTSKKAIFRFDAAASMPGKRIHAFLRWQNDSEKAKSGPYNQRVTVVVGD